MWSWLLGQGYDAMFGDMPKSQREQHLAEVMSKVPISRRFIGITNPYSQFAGKVEKAADASRIENWKQTRGLDMRADGYLYGKTVEKSEVNRYMKSFHDIDVYDKLEERFEFKRAIKDLPNRSLWLRMKGLDAKARAKIYYDRLQSADADERAQLRKEYNTVDIAGGVITDDFFDELSKLKREAH